MESVKISFPTIPPHSQLIHNHDAEFTSHSILLNEVFVITGRTKVEVIVKTYRDVRYFPDFTKLNLIHNCFIIQCFEGHSDEQYIIV